MLSSATRLTLQNLGRRFCTAAGSTTVRKIDNYADYEALKQTSHMMVGWFAAKWSTGAKMFEPEFEKLSASYPQATFYKVDMDEVPTAAYDMEVVDSPQIAILPLGWKPDGSRFDKSDLVSIRAELGRYDRVVPKAKEALDQINLGEKEDEPKPWVFDPSTGTTLPAHQSY
ncbi:hypothetical protein FOZ63_033973 [Perkinsus olseni]|uniref:Thioredoxin domain-containing protein n=1 Tax=Perkinsus olseni TaxID=32597 RepID=A0A7J6RJ66_PEROL|nr:hypothetical protein FOZ63_033973 [Perkinsus olseni]